MPMIKEMEGLNDALENWRTGGIRECPSGLAARILSSRLAFNGTRGSATYFNYLSHHYTGLSPGFEKEY